MTFRGFIALDIDVTSDMEKFMEEVESTRAPLNMVDTDKIHITMKFLGDTEEDDVGEISERIRSILKDFEPFYIRRKGVGAFPHLDYMKVVWIGLEKEPNLEDIAHGIEENLVPLGFSRSERSFSPHITVARVKGGKNKNRLKSVLHDYEDYDFGKQRVTKLKFKKSVLKKTGPVYHTLEEFYL
ncbi:MAG: RNA 2',3'-cyclic phosphodiesterase [Thermoplasmata archaeon]